MALRELDRFAHQEALVPRDRILREQVTVIGLGAIGRQVALQLTALGVPGLQLIDDEDVLRRHVTSQGYLMADIGRPKVEATGDLCHQIEHLLAVEEIRDRYRPTHSLGTSIFCCVDALAARAAIWRSAGRRCRFWADGRLLGETVRTLAAASELDRQHYASTLLVPPRVDLDAPPSTICAAALAAALLVHQFTRYLRELPLDVETSFNLLTSEFTIVSPPPSH